MRAGVVFKGVGDRGSAEAFGADPAARPGEGDDEGEGSGGDDRDRRRPGVFHGGLR
ncbi:hypothetical protein D3C85_1750460 [compost metagenome]